MAPRSPKPLVGPLGLDPSRKKKLKLQNRLLYRIVEARKLEHDYPRALKVEYRGS